MSVREDEREKKCSSRGLGIAAAAIGVGVGAALYYYFNKRAEHPEGELPHSLKEDSYSTISEHTTTDTSINESDNNFNNNNSIMDTDQSYESNNSDYDSSFTTHSDYDIDDPSYNPTESNNDTYSSNYNSAESNNEIENSNYSYQSDDDIDNPSNVTNESNATDDSSNVTNNDIGGTNNNSDEPNMSSSGSSFDVISPLRLESSDSDESNSISDISILSITDTNGSEFSDSLNDIISPDSPDDSSIMTYEGELDMSLTQSIIARTFAINSSSTPTASSREIDITRDQYTNNIPTIILRRNLLNRHNAVRRHDGSDSSNDHHDPPNDGSPMSDRTSRPFPNLRGSPFSPTLSRITNIFSRRRANVCTDDWQRERLEKMREDNLHDSGTSPHSTLPLFSGGEFPWKGITDAFCAGERRSKKNYMPPGKSDSVLHGQGVQIRRTGSNRQANAQPKMKRDSRNRDFTSEQCSICFDTMTVQQEVMALTCTHRFHQACILPWLQEKDTCPVCRKAAQ